MEDVLSHGWHDLVARLSGPLDLRFVFQPLMASFFAVRSGWRDAQERRPVFFWTVVGDATQRYALLRQMWQDVGKLFLVAAVLDVIYQHLILHGFFPVETLIVAMLLAIVPYLAVRGITNRIGSVLLRRKRSDPTT